MIESPVGSPPQRWWLPYVIACVLSLLTFACLMKLWQADLRVPFTYYGEAKYNALLVKTVLDFGWHLHNPAMGAPGVLDLRDVPVGDNNLHFLLIRLIGLFTNNYGLVFNIFLMLTFPLVTLSAMYALRQFGISWLVAGFTALIYTFLPFHFVRGQHHIFFAAYFMVPLAVMMVLWVGMGRVRLFDQLTGKLDWRNRKLIASLVICLLLSANGAYFAFFTCFFLLIAGFLILMKTRSMKSLLLPALLIATIAGGVTLNLLPSLIHLRQQGDTPVMRRYAVDAEVYSFRIAQLFLPVSGHRVFQMMRLKAAFNQRFFINENDDATLGLIGTIGFLTLVGWMFIKKPELSRIEEDGSGGIISHLSILNFSAVMLGTMGGLGALVALILTAKIRAYNRISIFVAFFALMALAILIDQFARRRVVTRQRHLIFCGLLAAAFLIGVLDQFAPRFVPDYAQIKTEFYSDQKFMRGIESTLPQEAMIFQLPVVPFPENPKVGKMFDYDHARGYLHTHGLRWSYGAMKGRAAEVWQKQLAAKSTTEMIDDLVFSGFQGIYLNRNGYNDSPSKVESELMATLGQPKITSDDGKLVFFDLREYEKDLRAKYAAVWDAKRDEALHPLLVVWSEGFSDLEGPPDSMFRWSAAEGRIEITNGSARTRRAKIEMSFATENDANLWITGPLITEQVRTGLKPQRIERELTIPPGRHLINLKSDARRVLAPGDFRFLVFKVINFKLTPEE